MVNDCRNSPVHKGGDCTACNKCIRCENDGCHAHNKKKRRAPTTERPKRALRMCENDRSLADVTLEPLESLPGAVATSLEDRLRENFEKVFELLPKKLMDRKGPIKIGDTVDGNYLKSEVVSLFKHMSSAVVMKSLLDDHDTATGQGPVYDELVKLHHKAFPTVESELEIKKLLHCIARDTLTADNENQRRTALRILATHLTQKETNDVVNDAFLSIRNDDEQRAALTEALQGCTKAPTWQKNLLEGIESGAGAGVGYSLWSKLKEEHQRQQDKFVSSVQRTYKSRIALETEQEEYKDIEEALL